MSYSNSVTTSEMEQPKYILLQPSYHPARTGPTFQSQVTSTEQLSLHMEAALQSDVLAVDFETVGGDYSADGFRAVGLALAYDSGSCYIPFEAFDDTTIHNVLDSLSYHKGLIAHNVYFDGGVFVSYLAKHPEWLACTYALLASLANESPEQKWGLKNAMTDLLLWENTNTIELDWWLIRNGYTRGTPPAGYSEATEDQIYDMLMEGRIRADHSKMHLAPADILGKYSVLDAEACYLLYTQILQPVASQFPGLIQQHSDFIHTDKLLIEQKIHGMQVDRAGLQARLDTVLEEINKIDIEFRNKYSHYIQKLEQELLVPLTEREPAKFKKNGDVSKLWLNWKQKMLDAVEGRLEEYKFNIQSGPQLRRLLYGLMQFPILVESEKGEPGVSIKALKQMSDVGPMLIERAYLLKERGFLEGYLEMTAERPTLHPSFRAPGTVTGRLSSKDPNLQQMPKTKAVMSCFHAPPGKLWVDIDFAALEPMVTTEASGDQNMFAIYGPDTANSYTQEELCRHLDKSKIKYKITEEGIEVYDR